MTIQVPGFRFQGSGKPPARWGGPLPLCRGLLAADRSGLLAFPIAVDLDLVHDRVHGIPWGFRVRVRVPRRCERVRLSFANAGFPYPAAGLRRVTALGAERDLTRENPASRGRPDLPTGETAVRHSALVIRHSAVLRQASRYGTDLRPLRQGAVAGSRITDYYIGP